MKKLVFALCMAALTATAVFAAGNFGMLSFPAPGEWNAAGIGVAKAAYVQVENAVPATGTVVLSKISADGSATNQLLSVTAAGGVYYGETPSNIWFVAGDKILRTGTATNGTVRIIVNQ